MTLLAAIAAGLVTGLHTATWGAYKDAPFEGLRWMSFVRSPVVAIAAAAMLWTATPLVRGDQLVIFIGLVYTAERLTVEWWKTFFRDDDQSAYSIPMRFGFNGKPIDNPLARCGVGGAVAIVFIVACVVGRTAQPVITHMPIGGFIGLAGIAGWFIAAGGAWKDAPIEGFSAHKFVRSPIVATLWAWPLAILSDNWVAVTLAAGGLSVATIETYKAYLNGGQPPGKFATKPVKSVLRLQRSVLRLVHAGVWVTLFVVLLVHVPWANPDSIGWLAPDEYARSLVTGACTIAAILVLASGGRETLPSRNIAR